jgi:hypothetical protein
MKTNTLICGKVCFIILAILFVSHVAAGETIKYEWGTQLLKFKHTLPSDKEWVQFKASEKPKYKNKILSYITAIDNKLLDKVVIVRIKSQPLVDYLFVNEKLYTIMENWGTIEQKTEMEIQSQLINQFGQPIIQQDKNFYIYSYNTDKTKVLFYLVRLPEAKSRCKVYYYTKQLFRFLIVE